LDLNVWPFAKTGAPVAVTVAVLEAVAVRVAVSLNVVVEVAVSVRDAVSVDDAVWVRVCVPVAVEEFARVGDTVAVGEIVIVSVGLPGAGVLVLAGAVAVNVALEAGVGEFVALPPGVKLGVGLTDTRLHAGPNVSDGTEQLGHETLALLQILVPFGVPALTVTKKVIVTEEPGAIVPTLTVTADGPQVVTVPWVVLHDPPVTVVFGSTTSLTVIPVAGAPPELYSAIVYAIVEPGPTLPVGAADFMDWPFCRLGGSVALAVAVVEDDEVAVALGGVAVAETVPEGVAVTVGLAVREPEALTVAVSEGVCVSVEAPIGPHERQTQSTYTPSATMLALEVKTKRTCEVEPSPAGTETVVHQPPVVPETGPYTVFHAPE